MNRIMSLTGLFQMIKKATLAKPDIFRGLKDHGNHTAIYQSKILIYLTLLFIIPAGVNAQKQKDEPISYRDDLVLKWENNNDSLELIAKSKSHAPIQIYFYSRKENKELNSFLLKPKDSTRLTAILKTESDSIHNARFQDSIRIAYYLGHESLMDPDLDHLYRLPFKKGKKYEVSQGFGGKFSHSGEISNYAIDFRLDVGEPVFAARGGLVVKVIDWFTKHGGEELKNSANKIVILHEDGTLGAYVHLDYKGSFVKEGEWVKEGDKIGVSGFTGFTRGPHLHFVVRREKDIAIPVYFKGYEGKTLKKGKRYKVN